MEIVANAGALNVSFDAEDYARPKVTALPVVAYLAATKTTACIRTFNKVRCRTMRNKINCFIVGAPTIAAVHTYVEARPVHANKCRPVFVAANAFRRTVDISCIRRGKGDNACQRQAQNAGKEFHYLKSPSSHLCCQRMNHT